MGRFKVDYRYSKMPMSPTIMSRGGKSYDNVIRTWNDDSVEFPDLESAMKFYDKKRNTWETEKIYIKDRKPNEPHYISLALKEFKNGQWVTIKSENYEDWYETNKERKFEEDALEKEKNKKQGEPAGIEDNIMENKKHMKKHIKLKENELKKIVKSKVRESLDEFYSMEDDMFRRASDTEGIESFPWWKKQNQQPATQPQDQQPTNQPLKESQFRKIVENKVRGMLKEMFEEQRQDQLHRYVMGWSQADSAWMVVYAHDLEEAEAMFENGEYQIENEG